MSRSFRRPIREGRVSGAALRSQGMKKSTVGAIVIVLMGLVTIGLWMLISPWLRERELAKTQDGGITSTVRIGGDGYLGYWIINSPEMKRTSARRGQRVEFTDDKGAYAERLEKFKRGEYDMIVLPVNSYLTHGAKHGYPGVIMAGICESKGADGIVGVASKFPEGKIQELNNADLRVVFTPDSPSSFLIDLVITDFDLKALKASSEWRVEAPGSEEVAKRASSKNGDVFVMWEPDLSKALAANPDLKKIWGSDKFGGYIVDVVVVNKEFLLRHEADVRVFFESYFAAMQSYGSNREAMISDMCQYNVLTREAAESMLTRIDWFDLDENARLQFGTRTAPGIPAREGVLNTILACQNILVRSGQLTGDPLRGDPLSIVNSGIIKELHTNLPTVLGQTDSGTLRFASLADVEWSSLREIGPLRVDPITFQQGFSLLDDSGKESVDAVAALLLNNYPTYRIAVRGHTGPGDEDENKKLSLQRADIVVQYLTAVHGIDAARLHAEGMGATQPPAALPGESFRALQYRMPRVEFVLLESNSF